MSDWVRRLEDELVRAGYDRRLRTRVRRSGARPVLVAACLAAVVAVVALEAGALVSEAPRAPEGVPAPQGARRPLRAAVSPARGGRHTRVTVSVTAQRATGVFGRTRRSYVTEARAVAPASACVVNRDRVFPDARTGARIRAVLDPARGEGGPLGWCRGRFQGTVTYLEGFACPARGTCRPPRGFPRRREVVARFSFEVK